MQTWNNVDYFYLCDTPGTGSESLQQGEVVRSDNE